MNAPASDDPAPAPAPAPFPPPPAPVQALLAAYSSLSVAALLAPLAEEGFTHRVLPASLGLPARDRAGFAAHAAGVFGLFAAFAMEPRAVHADAAAGVVVVRAVMTGTLRAAPPPPAPPWRSECVLLLRLTPDRARVAAIDEFIDSAQALEMRRRHAPGVFAPAAESLSSSASSFSPSYPSALAAWLAPNGGLIPGVVAGAAQLLTVCAAYQALTRSYSWFLGSEA